MVDFSHHRDVRRRDSDRLDGQRQRGRCWCHRDGLSNLRDDLGLNVLHDLLRRLSRLRGDVLQHLVVHDAVELAGGRLSLQWLRRKVRNYCRVVDDDVGGVESHVLRDDHGAGAIAGRRGDVRVVGVELVAGSRRCLVVLVVHVLVAEDVVVHVVLLGRLAGQHERLRKATHRMSIVGQLARYLHHHAVAKSRLSIDIRDLRMAVAEVQLLDLIMDVLLTDDQHLVLAWIRVQSAMGEA